MPSFIQLAVTLEAATRGRSNTGNKVSQVQEFIFHLQEEAGLAEIWYHISSFPCFLVFIFVYFRVSAA